MKKKNSILNVVTSIKRTVFPLALAIVLSANASAFAQAPSDLLEKAVYTEETKGDIDSAIQLYQQIVAEAKTTQAFAAQAQYRLGVCLHKKKNYAAARAAFEKLIKEFPDQKELVARAKEYAPGDLELQPVPWVDGELLQLTFKLQSGYRIGTVAYMADLVELDGRKVWRVGARTFTGQQGFSSVHVDPETFKPIRSRWKHDLLGDAEASFSSRLVEVKLKKADVKKVEVEGIVYDNEQVIHLMRRLPLAVGYRTTIPIITSLGGGSIIPMGLEVTGKELVEVEAGKFECFKVELAVKQTFWYSADRNRYLVKLEAGAAIGELAEIRQRKPGEPVQYRDPRTGLSVVAPAQWLFFKGEQEDPKTTVVLLDPEAVANSELTVQPNESLKPEAKESPRAWAEDDLTKQSKIRKDFKLREDIWMERTVAGHRGVSFVADFVAGKEKKVAYAVYLIGKTRSARFLIEVGSENFENFRKNFDAIIVTYRID